MIKVGDLLKLPSFTGCKVLAGLSGLNREVSSVVVAERFDFHRWTKGGEFVMSMMTFATEVDSGREISEWITSLIQSGASGLGIKRSVYNSDVPQFILEIGDSQSFPIMEMDDDVLIPTLAEEVYSKIISSKTHIFLRAYDAMSTLTEAAIEGWLSGFTDKLAFFLCNPVLIETANMNLVTASCHNAGSGSAFLVKRRSEHYVALIAEKLSNNIFEFETDWCMQFVRQRIEIDGASCEQITFPIECANNTYGFLSVIQSDRELESGDLVIVRIAINCLCLMAQKDSAYDVQEEVRHELLRSIIDPERELEAEYRAKLFGLNLSGELFCVIVEPENRDQASWFFNDSLLAQIAAKLHQVDDKIFLVRHRSMLILFCHLPTRSYNIPRGERKYYFMALENIQKIVEGLHNIPKLRFGAGRPGYGLAHLRLSFHEALSALKIAERFDLTRVPIAVPTPCAATQYYYLLDTLMQNEDKAWIFCKDILGPLMNAKLRNEDEYYKTLEAYLYYGKNLSEITRNTGIHRNTVKYRIEKIRDILEVESLSIETMVSIWVALQIRKHLLLKSSQPSNSHEAPMQP